MRDYLKSPLVMKYGMHRAHTLALMLHRNVMDVENSGAWMDNANRNVIRLVVRARMRLHTHAHISRTSIRIINNGFRFCAKITVYSRSIFDGSRKLPLNRHAETESLHRMRMICCAHSHSRFSLKPKIQFSQNRPKRTDTQTDDGTDGRLIRIRSSSSE